MRIRFSWLIIVSESLLSLKDVKVILRVKIGLCCLTSILRNCEPCGALPQYYGTASPVLPYLNIRELRALCCLTSILRNCEPCSALPQYYGTASPVLP